MEINSLRQQVKLLFSNDESLFDEYLDLSIGVLVFVSVAIFVAETYPLPPSLHHNLYLLDQIIQVIFIIEYLLRFWSADYKWQYFTNLYSIIDFLAIVPFFLTSFDTRFMRLLRWFRILRLIRLVVKIKNEDTLILTRIFFTVLAIIFIFSGLIYQLEHPINPQQFPTFLDAFYFAVVTMTTVGYGDKTPISDGGKLMTVLMILTGIALIPVQLGEAFQRLFQGGSRIYKPCPNCDLTIHDIDAVFCKKCGTKIPP
jgi:voltage-gated potassium channel